MLHIEYRRMAQSHASEDHLRHLIWTSFSRTFYFSFILVTFLVVKDIFFYVNEHLIPGFISKHLMNYRELWSTPPTSTIIKIPRSGSIFNGLGFQSTLKYDPQFNFPRGSKFFVTPVKGCNISRTYDLWAVRDHYRATPDVARFFFYTVWSKGYIITWIPVGYQSSNVRY